MYKISFPKKYNMVYIGKIIVLVTFRRVRFYDTRCYQVPKVYTQIFTHRII